MDLQDYPQPRNLGKLTNNDILNGPFIPAIDRLKIFSADQFEDFIREWVAGYLMKTGKYQAVKKSSGSGDMGRDVIGQIDSAEWDNYQCKHYDNALSPSMVYLELGKLVYYTCKGYFSIPKNFYFVSPKGIGPSLNNLFENPSQLKAELLTEWDKKCKGNISATEEIPLTEELKAHINKMDFKIFKGYDPQTIINEHQTTSYYAARFGGGFQKRRPSNTRPPDVISTTELNYTNQLFAAYSDHTKTSISKTTDLDPFSEIQQHFNRQRIGFYSADTLKQFSRDTLPQDVDYFEDLKDEFFTGVVDVAAEVYPDGYARVKATTNYAKSLQITSSPLSSELTSSDREGICHHLANEKRLIWVKH